MDEPLVVGLLLHGAGTDADSALRLLRPVVPPDYACRAETHDGTLEGALDVVARIERFCGKHGMCLGLLGGISVGAHAVAAWAARGSPRWPLRYRPELVLAMPAWTGPPDEVAALTAASADEIEREGTAGMLARLTAEAGDDWVVDELVRSWTDADPASLARSLRAAAASRAPTLDELARIRARVAVVALADDPLHPLSVAEAWADAIPGARLVVVPRDAPSSERAALGLAARAALDGL
jgi:pimeloyl-ACP methyl ester carboxylesterase